MRFFLLWIKTRLKETGWPKSRGLIKRQRVVTDRAIIAAAQDTIRLAIVIGASHPDVAKSIAAEYLSEDGIITKDEVLQVIDQANLQAETKMSDLGDIEPAWLRFSSVEVGQDHMAKHIPLLPGDDEFEMSGYEAQGLINQALAISGMAMCWGLKHPDLAETVFDVDSDWNNSQNTQYFVAAADPLSHVSGLNGKQIYAGFLHMAEGLIDRYKSVDGFIDYSKLA